MKRVLLALIACFASVSALAADLPNRKAPPVFTPPPPPVFSWTGFYVGVQLGYQWGNESSTLNTPGGAFLTGEPTFGANGVVGGLHVGYNYQIAQFVFGIEGEGDGSSYRGSELYAGGLLRETERLPVEGSVRGRLGYAWDRLLIYGTGGVSFASIQNTSYAATGFLGVPAGTYDSAWVERVGWTAGGGVEYAVDDNWSLRVEYRYTDYGDYNFTLVNTGLGRNLRLDPTDSRVEAGLSYKFDLFAPPAPIAVKY